MIPKSSRGNTILGTGYSVYKKKSLMVSDTQGNKSFLAARMRKTSLSPLWTLCRVYQCTRGLLICVIHIRLACVDIRVEQEYRDDAISTYVTRPNEHLSRWETKPHGFVCSTLFVTFVLFSIPKLLLTMCPLTKEFQVLTRQHLFPLASSGMKIFPVRPQTFFSTLAKNSQTPASSYLFAI